ncbi:hypothetical protein [Mucilaginibacter pedocola]|nr:hypothetical protein [Mucilaginibacter pedocola]
MPDYIIYKSDTIGTYNLIVERYLQNQHPADSAKLFGLSFRDGASFNCWRGYQAIYKIENDSLFLVDMIQCGTLRQVKRDTAWSNGLMKKIFGNEVVNGKVFINWFTGDINFPLNSKLVRWDGVFYRIFEKERIITISGGKLSNTEDVLNYVNAPHGIKREYGVKLSDILFKKVKKIKWRKLPDCDCSDEYVITIGPAGNVSKVALAGENRDEVSENEGCRKLIFDALRKLQFDIIKDKGKPIAEDVYLEIWVEDNGKTENWTN